MTSHPIVTGLPSTHGDSYQLNTTTLLRHSTRTYPEQEIVFRTVDGGWDRYTYADMFERVGKSAHALTGLGAGPGTVVGILDWNSKRHMELYWAIPGIASVMLQMNLRLAPVDLAYVTDHAEASIVLVDESLLPVAEALVEQGVGVKTWVVMTDKPLSEISTTLPGVVHWEDALTAAEPGFDWPMIDETSAYSACYTTGTTGRPKGVYYSHRGIYLHTLSEAAQLKMGDDDTVMIITPMFHGQGWGLPQSAIYSAAKVVLPGRYTAEDTSALVDAMISESVTVANGAPAIFEPMLDYIRTLKTRPDFSRARLLSGATEPSLTLMRGFHDLTGADIIHAYGATETTPLVTVNAGLKHTLRDVLSEDEKWDLKRAQGLLVNGIDIKVVGPDGTELPHDGVSQGEVLMRGPWIIERYHKMEDKGDAFADGWWRSGDAGTIRSDGYLKLTDRIKDVVKSGGEWISSIDMENAIVAHPQVREAAVVGIEHPKWQERPVAIVVQEDGADLGVDDIHAVLEDKFAKWQLPDIVIFADALPRTSVGKLDKKTLRTDHADLYRGAEE
ncbi:UNVERIFIED_ORG: fatty-acyl-CoA synthase [Dietzia maris]|uniref:long-chain-fatty-acid--CoA ligase n=1 Tax=Dietzia TaxID=37914 RepID=UPI000BDF5C3A|nr:MULTISPECIES: long-chain-fatty-acid--CoA ligase [unclassified Dietzia]MCY1658889.1 long-chain-fatty-acid--CoA ligase [Dietzia sp. SL131]MDV3353900.1 long-chain-fatty-acid--CoA ligase [Dietzia sp. IN118]